MQLKWLEDLLALAEAGSLTRAAQRRHVTHPAFGRRIRALETWAGAPLIDRDAPALRFTVQGEAVLEAARETIAALAEARRASGKERDGDRPLHIATGRTLARTLLVTWYARMLPLIGERKLKVTTHFLQEVASMLESGEADFLLTYFHPLLTLRLDARRFSHLRVADEALVPVSGCGPDARALHALSRRRASPLLSYASGLALGRLVDDHLNSKLKPPRLWAAIELDSPDAAHEFALRGFGIAWLPRSMVAADCRLGRLIQIGDRSDEIPLEVRIYRRRHRLPALGEALWTATAAGTET
jgi:LysR family transcriptional regulator, hypochlorite-specific transcription factor HypT